MRQNSGDHKPGVAANGDLTMVASWRAISPGGVPGAKVRGVPIRTVIFAKACQAAALALHLPDAVESHGHNGNAKIFRAQTDAGLKRRHAAIRRIVHHERSGALAFDAAHDFRGITRGFKTTAAPSSGGTNRAIN